LTHVLQTQPKCTWEESIKRDLIYITDGTIKLNVTANYLALCFISGRSQFKSRPGDWLSLLQIFMVSLSHSRKILGQNLKLAITISLFMLSKSLFINHCIINAILTELQIVSLTKQTIRNYDGQKMIPKFLTGRKKDNASYWHTHLLSCATKFSSESSHVWEHNLGLD
jgi:hypothetical protein